VQDTLDAVETLLKKHEAFERAAATQEERFLALERITTVSGRYFVSLQHWKRQLFITAIFPTLITVSSTLLYQW